MRTALAVLCLSASLCAAADNQNNRRLTVRVSPAVAMAPAFVQIRTIIEADADNRALEVVLDSPEFLRSSQITLDGRNAPAVSVFELRDVPPGLYEVRAVLVGASGPRATAVKLLKVAASAGTAR